MGLLSATLLSHPEGNGQPYWRRGELSEAIKITRKDGDLFASSHGGRPPKYTPPPIEFNEACIVRRMKGNKVLEECTGRFIKWNPRTNRATVLTEANLFKSGTFLMET